MFHANRVLGHDQKYGFSRDLERRPHKGSFSVLNRFEIAKMFPSKGNECVANGIDKPIAVGASSQDACNAVASKHVFHAKIVEMKVKSTGFHVPRSIPVLKEHSRISAPRDHRHVAISQDSTSPAISPTLAISGWMPRRKATNVDPEKRMEET